MLIDLARHAKKRAVILAIEKISIDSVRNGDPNKHGDEKILHMRPRGECNHSKFNHITELRLLATRLPVSLDFAPLVSATDVGIADAFDKNGSSGSSLPAFLIASFCVGG